MVHNEEKFQEAVKLRKRGFTLAEIAKYCGVSKSTVSNWLKGEFFSQNITKLNKNRAGQENAKRLKLVNKVRYSERQKQYRDVAAEATVSYQHFKHDSLFVSGVTVFASTGDLKATDQIRLASNRMSTHRIFIKFAVKYLGVERHKIRFWLLLSPAHPASGGRAEVDSSNGSQTRAIFEDTSPAISFGKENVARWRRKYYNRQHSFEATIRSVGRFSHQRAIKYINCGHG